MNALFFSILFFVLLIKPEQMIMCNVMHGKVHSQSVTGTVIVE